MSIIGQCLSPKKVVNRYTHEEVMVPCGCCSACRNSRGLRMTQRLDQERLSWKYCIFFTATYDNDNMPLLKKLDFHLVDTSSKRVHPICGITNISLLDFYHKYHISKENEAKSNRYIDLAIEKFGGVPYLSTVDAQRLIKRLRINFQRQFKALNKDEKSIYHEKVPTFRYCICGEYGETFYRPHFHGIIYTNSEFIAQTFGKILRKCWKFGNVDFSFVASSNAGYVAKYVNSFAHLPAIYKAPKIHPFLLFSKHPALGSLAYNTQSMRQMFLDASCQQIVLSAKAQGVPRNVPLWRTFQNQLYPKLTGFDELTHIDRVRIYTASDKSFDPESFACFKGYVNTTKDTFIQDYVRFLDSHDGDLDSKLMRWYLISRRVITQASVFEISVRDYVKTIENFYNDKDYLVLKNYYKDIEEYTKEHSVIQLIGIDREFINSVRDLDVWDLDAHEILYFKSFKDLDFDKFFSTDMTERLEYQSHLDFENSDVFVESSTRNFIMETESLKVKKKNAYVQMHRDSLTEDFYKQVSQINF